MEELGQIVDQIRRNRNITIESLCEGVISPSTYSRFVRGKTSLASDSFVKIISGLHMTFAMFLQDYQDMFKLKHDYAILNHARADQNLDIMLDLIADYQAQQGQKGWRPHDERFLKVAQMLYGLMDNTDVDRAQIHDVKTFLASLKSFTDNDFFAVRLLLPYLNYEDAQAIISVPLLKNADREKSILGENLYYVAGQMYIKALKAGDQKNVQNYYKIIDKVCPNEMDLGGKISHKVYTSIHQFFAGETEQATQNFNQLIVLYKDLNLFHQASHVKQLIQELAIPLKQAKVTL